MSTVDQDIRTQVAKLQRERPGLSELDAEAEALRDPDLYQRYTREASTVPASQPRQTAPRGSAAEVEAFTRADRLVRKSTGMDMNEAVAQVFREDPELYQAYARKQEAPTFGDQLLGAELDGVYPLVNALMSTLRGIAEASTSDKGVQIQVALREFSAAVGRVAGQAGIAVPTDKQAMHAIPERIQRAMVQTAAVLGGMERLDAALEEIRGWSA